MKRKRPYVGLDSEARRIVFKSDIEPTEASHGALFVAVIGPFVTVRAANYMSRYGQGNPHLQCVSDCERIAKLEPKVNPLYSID